MDKITYIEVTPDNWDKILDFLGMRNNYYGIYDSDSILCNFTNFRIWSQKDRKYVTKNGDYIIKKVDGTISFLTKQEFMCVKKYHILKEFL